MPKKKIPQEVLELPQVQRLEAGIREEIPRLGWRETVFGTMSAMHWQRTLKRRVRQMRAYGSNKSWWRSQFTRSKVMRNVVLGMVFVFAGGLLSFFILFAWFAKDLPQPDKIVRREGFATKLMDRNEELLYEVFVDQQRTPVTLEQVPDYLQQATIAIEDKNFYQHSGFDVQGYARIVWNLVSRRRLIGGSTLTQQLVKNVLLTNERSLTRKMKEFILAVQIENKYSKDEILQMYLNEAPYGGTAWGVGTAAQAYFNKDVAELSLTEAAILAGMPQLPSVYSPFAGDPTAYIGRTEAVLRRMREDGFIDKEMEASVAAELATVEFSRGFVGIKAPHFSLHVKKLLEQMYGESLVANGGLKVTTSLDLPMHEKAQEIVTEEIEKVADSGIGNGAALVMDPVTGEVWSMVGSKDFFAEDYDGQVNVTMSLRQPGSAIKPVTYVTGFRKGMMPATMIMDVPTSFPSGDGSEYSPVNYDGSFRGPIQLRFALGSSLNVPAVKLLAMVGIRDMLQTAYDMGITTLEPTSENLRRFGLAVTLGGAEVRLTELTAAYSAFANGGTKIEPVFILKVEDRDGKTLFEHKRVSGKRVLQEEETFLINHVLSDNNARLLTFGANSFLNLGQRPVAVKTGTTNDKRDNWTIGWSRNVMVGVWVGNNDNSPMKQVASGVTGASPIWRRIMLEFLDEYPAEAWPIPSRVQAVMVDTVSGYPEHSGFPARSEYVIAGTLPNLPDPVHTYLKLCKGQEKLASEVDIAQGNYDEKEYYVFAESTPIEGKYSWQEAIDAWTSTHPDPKYKAPKEYCDSQSDILVEMERPEKEHDYDGTTIPIRVRVVYQGEIESVEILVDGSNKKTLTLRPFESEMTLDSGRYTLKARVKTKDGKQAESSERRIGVGGVSWQEPTPTAQPQPTVAPTPLPSPTPGIVLPTGL